MSTEAYEEIARAIGGYAAGKAARGALQLYLGRVRQVEPLEIEIGTTVQRAADGKIYCNPALLRDYTRETEQTELAGRLESNGTVPGFPVTGGTLISGKAKTTDFGFDVGDNLLVLSRDQQLFYILCREVLL